MNLLRTLPVAHDPDQFSKGATSGVRVRYEFRFASLIAPSHVAQGSILSLGRQDSHVARQKRMLFKKSYLLASWFYYLARKDPYRAMSAGSSKGPKLSILPSRQIIYTLTKAPMAHKTNSKEQFLFKYYNFKLSADLRLEREYVPSSAAQGALALTTLETRFPVFETNVLFLKYAKVLYPFTAPHLLREL